MSQVSLIPGLSYSDSFPHFLKSQDGMEGNSCFVSGFRYMDVLFLKAPGSVRPDCFRVSGFVRAPPCYVTTTHSTICFNGFERDDIKERGLWHHGGWIS